jgi:predicted acyl esterase
MALATRPKGLAAVVVQSPLDSGYKGVYDNGVHYGGDWFSFTAGYQQMSVVPPTLNDGTEAHTNNLTGTADPACYVDANVGALDPDVGTPYWQSRELARRAGASRVPVLWSHGFNDVNTKPTNLLDTWNRLRGPKRGWFGQWDHVRGNQSDLVGRNGFMDEAMAWFDHYLKGAPLPAYPAVRIQDSEGEWRSEARWPPADAVTRRMPLLPGSYVDGPGNQADQPLAGSWTVSQPAAHDVRLAGAMTLRVSASAPVGATLVATVYDLPPEGAARMLTRGAHLIPASGSTSFALWPEDWVLARGHRLAVHLSGDDALVYQPVYSGSPVTVTGGRLELPVLARPRRTEARGGPAAAERPVATIDRSELAGRQVRADFGPTPG